MSTLDELLLPSAESLKNENRDEFIKALMSSLVLTTKSSNNLPNDYKDNNRWSGQVHPFEISIDAFYF